MPQQEYTIIDRQLRNISWRNIITLLACTATSVATVVGVYYGLKTDQEIMKLEIKVLEQRVSRLEESQHYLSKTTLPAYAAFSLNPSCFIIKASSSIENLLF